MKDNRDETRPDGFDTRLSRRDFQRMVAPAMLLPIPERLGKDERLEGGLAPIAAVVHGTSSPEFLDRLRRSECRLVMKRGAYTLQNAYLSVSVSSVTGNIRSVLNHITNEQYHLVDDTVGVLFTEPRTEWMVDSETQRRFRVGKHSGPERCALELTTTIDGIELTLAYSLSHHAFWCERSLRIKSPTPISIDEIRYGRLKVQGGAQRILELGAFDRPVLQSVGDGGVFGGVSWWYTERTNDGIYRNTNGPIRAVDIEFPAWYLGVFRPEEGEPYAGWLWYRTFLFQRRQASTQQASWSYWNAGWGQWGIDIDDPATGKYVELCKRLRIRSILFGGGEAGKGIPAYLRLAATDRNMQAHLALLKRAGIEAGLLGSLNHKDKWSDAGFVAAETQLLKQYAGCGFGAIHFDFFSTSNTWPAHRNVYSYFETARKLTKYTECHLGMAQYGPQLQREVELNHPTDLKGNDIAAFSADWATFLGFRHSRREWQQRYQYLMPEVGLYYFVTHYSNWGHPKHNTDPEPQQFLYRPHAYCGIGFNFHDHFGFRDSIAAASAFTPYFVFGHLDLGMPEADVQFARAFLEWVSSNHRALAPARVCHEDAKACVVSKLEGGKGLVYLLNYGGQSRTFRITVGSERVSETSIRQIYPVVTDWRHHRLAAVLDCTVKGESCAILEVGGVMKTLPPSNPSRFPIDVTEWTEIPDGYRGRVHLPELRVDLGRLRSPGIPNELISLDQQGTDPYVLQIGKGRLPQRFLELYRFRDSQRVETWKFVPWAYPDRVWLIYLPQQPVSIQQPLPACSINGMTVHMVPRIDYRKKSEAAWSCPLYFADITTHCRFNAPNTIELRGIEGLLPPVCFVACAADRYEAKYA